VGKPPFNSFAAITNTNRGIDAVQNQTLSSDIDSEPSGISQRSEPPAPHTKNRQIIVSAASLNYALFITLFFH